MVTSFIILLLLGLSINEAGQTPPSLEAAITAKKWQRRVLLMYAREGDNTALQTQQRLLADQRPGLDERDLDQMVVLETDLSAADRQYLHGGDRKLPASAPFMLYLIGKDGGVKQRYSRPVTSADLFRVIDAMPMRQSEVRRTN